MLTLYVRVYNNILQNDADSIFHTPSILGESPTYRTSSTETIAVLAAEFLGVLAV